MTEARTGRREMLAAGATFCLAPLLGGCRTRILRRALQKQIQSRLTTLLGPAEHYSVRIPGTPDREIVQGRARRVEIVGRGILAQRKLRVERLSLVLIDVRYLDDGPLSISSPKSELEIELTEVALNDYLSIYQSRYRPRIRLLPDQVQARILYRFLGSPLDVEATGRLRIEDGVRLLFDAEKASLSLIDSPGFGERFVEDRVNPLVDLKRVEFPARLEEVSVQDGRLTARGSAVLPAPEGRRD